jgi:geranylgeranyl diphosphate synthase type II
MNTEHRLLLKKKAVDAELDRILPQDESILYRAMRYAVFSGGKRFRPLLALSSGECFGIDQALVLPYACALELIHNYSLIHDDLPILDDDDYRRGKPSCHKTFGEDIALLAGDGLLTVAFEVLAEAPCEESLLRKKERVIQEISRCAGAKGMIGGQVLDITLPVNEVNEEVLRKMMLKKTGALITASVKIGPLFGGASQDKLDAITDYGENTGIAFQIRDDILDDSAPTSSEARHRRPSSVSFFGREEAEHRLKRHVDAAIQALDEASLESDELRFLSLKLLDTEENSGREKDSG